MENADIVISGKNEIYDSDDSDSDSDSEDVDTRADDITRCLRVYIDRLLESVPALEQLCGDEEDLNIIEEEVRPGFDVSASALPFCQNIIDKYTKADREFVRRLGEANWERFCRLRECRELAANLDPLEDIATGNHCQQTLSGLETTFQDSGLGSSIKAVSNIAVARPTSDGKAIQPALATSLASSASLISTNTCIGDHGARIPPSPEGALTGNPFVCEYCGQTSTLR